MSLEHILLGCLQTPATGYELGREFAGGARHFWFAERSQIYPALKKMEARGWLRARDAASPVGPDRRVYQITAAGRRALTRWLTAGPQIGRERLGYVAQAYFLDAVEPEEAAGVIEAMRVVWRAKLEGLETIERQILTACGTDQSGWPAAVFHPYTALRLGMHQYKAKLAWCEETLTLVRRRSAALAEA